MRCLFCLYQGRREPAYKGGTSLEGGPTFFINGSPLVGARPLAEFQAVIDRLLKQHPFS
jgi:hypothetical protein